MSNKIDTRLGVAVIIIIAITAGMFVWKYEKGQENTEQSRLTVGVNESETLKSSTEERQNPTHRKEDQIPSENISFCGKIYSSDQVMINNSDVIKIIAKIAEKETWLCKNMDLGNFQESGIGIAQKMDNSDSNIYLVSLFHKDNFGEEKDPFSQSPYIFKINFQNKNVSYQNQLDGSFKSIGAIK